MPFEVRIPELGESVTDGVIVRWAVADGARVAVDDILVELETDKAAIELPSERAGVLTIRAAVGATVAVGEVIATIDETAAVATPPSSSERPAPDAAPPATASPAGAPPSVVTAGPAASEGAFGPAVRRLVDEHGLDPGAITATGPGGRLTKGDVLAHVAAGPAPAAAAPEPSPAESAPVRLPVTDYVGEREERVPMGRIRQRIAERLVAAQQTAAILTTFNEVDMTVVMALRAAHKERFEQVHGVRLGFMSFFSAACCAALKEIPAINAQIQDDDIVYRHYVNLGIAVGTDRGLVVPVVKEADRRSLADIEREIGRLAERARSGTLTVDELTGGTFTISNGGVYGSLMSTPILNPPQSGILGLHKIQKRPVVVDDEIVVRPMMYLALSYDHRIVDGEQAVTFLVRIKEHIEDPTRLLLGV